MSFPASVPGRELKPGYELAQVDWTAANTGASSMDLYNRIKWCLTEGKGVCLAEDVVMSPPFVDPGAIEAGATVSGRTVFAIPEGGEPAWMACQRGTFGSDTVSATAFFALPR